MIEKTNLIISGGTGYLGELLQNHFKENYTIIILTRNKSKLDKSIKYINWEENWGKYINRNTIIINLAGKSINCLFTMKNKQTLLSSRMETTKKINTAIQNAKEVPKLFINASGISIYKSSYRTDYDDYSTEYGNDFLSQLTQKWEAEFYKTKTPNTRKVAIRLAPVLGKKSKAIQSLLPVVSLGLGGKQGKGKQLFPFIHESDFIRAIQFIIEHKSCEGSINIIAPVPTTNKQFMAIFREILSVKIGIPTPSFLLHLSKYISKVEPEIILASQYAKPTKLQECGFTFKFPTIQKTLQDILKN